MRSKLSLVDAVVLLLRNKYPTQDVCSIREQVVQHLDIQAAIRFVRMEDEVREHAAAMEEAYGPHGQG